jgi:GT2 family glycosyltransferase
MNNKHSNTSNDSSALTGVSQLSSAFLAHTAAPLLDISVIIVSWNARRFLEECLDSLTRGVSRSFEVIVVDNASTDGSPEMVASGYPWVTLIQTGENLGFSRGNNVGIKRSRGKYIALVNSDVNVSPGCLDRLASFLDNHSDVGMVGPKITYGDRRTQSSCRRLPSLWNNACEVFCLNKLFPRSECFAGEHMFYFSYDHTREVEVLVGCFILARRDAVTQFGLLDENFWMYGEDIDWCHRCRQAGWKVMFYPCAEAVHYCGGSSSSDPGRFALAQQQARLQFWAKYRSWLAQSGLIVLLTSQCCLRLLASGVEPIIMRSRRRSTASRARTQIACLRALWGKLFFRSSSETRGHL